MIQSTSEWEAIFMRVIDMEFGYNGEYLLNEIFAMNQYWENNYIFNMSTPRPTSALVYMKGCKTEYTWDDGFLTAQNNEIIYIPQGSVYKTKFIEKEKNKTSTMLIEFTSLLSDGEPFVFCPEPTVVSKHADEFFQYFSEIVRLFNWPLSSPALEKSVLYRILSALGYASRTTKLLTTEFAPIVKGIMYMESNIVHQKGITEIANMCHVSPYYFRKLFKKYSGVSPIEYQIQAKITHAKRLLNTNTMRISEISDALGFFDAAYFSKIFKKYTGVSPKEYAKKSTQNISC